MTRDRAVRISKLLSLGLRHDPNVLGLTLDTAGWSDVGALLSGLSKHGEDVTEEELKAIVAGSDKQRFALSADGLRIRANQGHSVAVDLGLPRREPPDLLFHGTVARLLEPIQRDGLVRGARRHVHLSADRATAEIVAQRRRGDVVLLHVRARPMHDAGYAFFLSHNGVWLTEHVPAAFIDLP